MQPVDTVLLLQSSPLLERATGTQLVGLADIARPIPLKTGVDPLAGAEPSILVVLSGEFGVEREGAEPENAEAGRCRSASTRRSAGVRVPGASAEVVTEGQALRFLRSDVFDLLADDIGLLQGIFCGLLRSRRRSLVA